jgi:hypothetical protein
VTSCFVTLARVTLSIDEVCVFPNVMSGANGTEQLIERDENEERVPFRPSERVAIALLFWRIAREDRRLPCDT